MVINRTAYAKLNLDLKLTGEKTNDDYHILKSRFVKINLGAELEIDISPNVGSFESKTIVDNIENNKNFSSISKIVGLWSKKRETPVCVNVKITNPLPYGAGLGVSSSYAAEVLLALEEYYKAEHKNDLPLDIAEMQSIAIKVGCDVPFFVSQLTSAYVEGIGDIISPCPTTNASETFLLHFPPYKIFSAEAYKEADKQKITEFIDLSQNKMYYNYLVRTTGVKSWKLSGSGSTFFIPSPSNTLLKKTSAWEKKGIKTELHYIC